MAKAKTTAQKLAEENDAYPRDEAEGNVKSIRRVKKPDFSKGKKLAHRIAGFWRPVKGETFSFLLMGTENRRGEGSVDDDGVQRKQIIGQLLSDCSVQRINAARDDEGNAKISMGEEGEVVSFGDVAGLKPLLDLEMGGKFAVEVTVIGQEKMKSRTGKFWNLDVTYVAVD